MFSFAGKAIEIADKIGADFGDIRVVEMRRQELGVRNGGISDLDDSVTLGFGVRILLNGAWGFASSDVMTAREVERVTRLAADIAAAGSRLKKGGVRLSPEPAWRDIWQTPFLKDPFAVPVEKKLDLLFEVDRILRKDRRIRSSVAGMTFIRKHQWHLTTGGSAIEQVLLSSGAGYTADAVDKGEAQSRSYPSAHGGQVLAMGYELIENLDLAGNAERVREEALALLTARQCPEGRKDLVIYGNQLALQIHESVGHAVELDRVLGYEESYTGSSFATLDKLGSFRYGSPLVNLVADATLPGGLATAGYDDDAVKAQRWHIVRDGVLAGYMTNREFAGRAGESRSRGSCRADDYDSIPITRICNLSLMPGKEPEESLIAGIKDGVVMENNKSWSIDQKRLNFQFGCEIGWLVRNGKKCGMVKNPVYQGITPEFWNSCDAIADERSWRLWGVPNCGKGQPTQVAMMCHGGSPARFRKVQVGTKA